MGELADTTINAAPVSRDQKPGPREIFEQLGGLNLHRAAYDKGMNLSAYLEHVDPSSEYKDRSNLDAFGRLMKVAGIVTQSDSARGYYADEFDVFMEGGPNRRALAQEWAARQWRKAAKGVDQNTRNLLLSDMEALGDTVRPYVDAAAARMKQLAPAIPLSEIVAITTPIDTDAYRAFYLTDVTADQRMVRVVEGTEIPSVTITGGDHTIRLKKYGRAIEATYETLRRARIDKVALWIARVAIQNESDKVATAIDTLVSGDGNANTAATSHNLTTLDTGATAGTLTLKGYLAFKMKFTNPYAISTALVQEDVALSMLLLNMGSANVPLVFVEGARGFGGMSTINPELAEGTRLGWTADAPASKIVGFDRRFALEHVTEIGSSINETERYVSRQTEVLYLTETEGYAVFDQNATKVLDISS